MLLREFLYVDTDKVRSMLGQLDEGVAEEARDTSRHEKRSEGGVKGFASHYQNWGTESYVSKSLGDTLFPSLENMLESDGLLSDVSEQMTDSDYWTSGEMENDYPPGSLIRITASGSLFDARYVAAVFSSFGAATLGFQGLGTETPAAPTPPIKKQQRPPRPPASSAPHRPQLEDEIPEFVYIENGEPAMDAKQLKSLLKVARGLFTPGLHLNLFPIGGDEVAVGVRLQEGRQYLDGDPDILFARYGTGEQEWTVVGSVGHYGRANVPMSESPQLLSADQRVLRARTAKFINNFMGLIGSQGFSDLPQSPGFSMVPLAVYRQNPHFSLPPAIRGDE
ncbi:hypothetical protein ACFWU3_05110 [Streptomyces sp. NPDC058685]|uniref:DUF6414 family protein n=1 Tax=Streptomyces sp. NPDC058685 TaxID=3346598 RepID=UPI00364636B5